MNLSYSEAEDYLFTQLPAFERQGNSGYKPGLDTSNAIDNYFKNPHKHYKTIHVAGTNGKGSVSNFLASILQESGYKVGLFTSPHIVDFKERIRVNGKKIDEQFVTDFVNLHCNKLSYLKPSFFELTSAMAFEYFRVKQVDVAVIEVGLGGRLDSTNIITPILSVITNIALDHTQFLGTTLKQIAGEKAGIIKRGVPVVVGESDSRTNIVFLDKAAQMESPIILASNKLSASVGQITPEGKQLFNVFSCGEPVYKGIKCAQLGLYQQKNVVTTIAAVELLIKLGFNISSKNIFDGFENVNSNTGFYGRWQIIKHQPLTICDTGHNPAGIQYVVNQLGLQTCSCLRIVVGFVEDKDVSSILKMLPKTAVYYFVNADTKRALPAIQLKSMAEHFELQGNVYNSVLDGYNAALQDSSNNDFVFVGGSNYVVAEIFGKF